MSPALEASVSLTWAMVVATYERPDVLVRCLRLAAGQSRPPSEIVVVDGSPGWARNRDRVRREVAAGPGRARWVYVEAARRSAAAQRNQGIGLASADVVFLFDDDSLMYPECADAIMQVYEADAAGRVAGVSAVLADRAPDEPGGATAASAARGAGAAATTGRGVRRLARALLRADDIFVPYDERYPDHELPADVEKLRVGHRRSMAGMTMTARRPLALREPFEEILLDRGPEDSDMSYRLSRHGALVTALDARVFHMAAEGGRYSLFSREALGAMGPLVLHRIYSSDAARSRRLSRRLLRRRLAIACLKDLGARRWSLPAARGIWFALRRVGEVFGRSEPELRAWYPAVQQRLLSAERPGP